MLLNSTMLMLQFNNNLYILKESQVNLKGLTSKNNLLNNHFCKPLKLEKRPNHLNPEKKKCIMRLNEV